MRVAIEPIERPFWSSPCDEGSKEDCSVVLTESGR